jgi:hypothetical protein
MTTTSVDAPVLNNIFSDEPNSALHVVPSVSGSECPIDIDDEIVEDFAEVLFEEHSQSENNNTKVKCEKKRHHHEYP